MVREIIWSLQAQADRKEILNYWTLRNKSTIYSKKLNFLIIKAIRLISAYPNIGAKTNLENIRAKVVRDYLIIYEITEGRVEILCILE